MQVRLPVRDVPDVFGTATAVCAGPVAAAALYPPGPFRRTSAVELFGASTTGNGGRVDTPSTGIAGLADFTLGILFTADVWVPTRGNLAHQWGTNDYAGNPLPGPDSWLLRVFQASGTPVSGTWADGLQFWIRVGTNFRYMNIPLAAVAPNDVVQLVIRGRMGLESSPGILAPDAQRLQAWLAINAATSLALVAAGHGDGYGSTTQHPATMPASGNPFRLGGGPYGGGWDWDGKILDAFMVPRALSDAEISALRPGPNPAHFAPVVLSSGSWWRMGAGVGDAAPDLVDQGPAGDDATLTNGGAAGAQPQVVAV